MAATSRVLLVGNSHANCIAASVRTRQYEAATLNYQLRIIAHGATALPGGLVVRDSQGKDIANPIVLKAIQDNARLKPKPDIWVVSVLGGNQASRLSLFRQAADYRMSGQTPSAPATGTFVAEDLMVATLARQIGSLHSFLKLLPRRDVAGVIHVEAPPPVRSAEHIATHLPDKTVALAASNGLGPLGPNSIGDARFRLRTWQCQSRATRQAVESADAHYLLPPPEAVDPDGFLAEQYWADAMHASTGYGATVLRMIERYITQVEREEIP